MEDNRRGSAGDLAHSPPSPPPATAAAASLSPPEPVAAEEAAAGGGDGPPDPLPLPLPPPEIEAPRELEQAPQEEAQGTAAAILTDELREMIVRQVEYYFSDDNLPTDTFLLKHIKKNKGFVPIPLIASFRKMSKLVQDNSLIELALRSSSKLVVSSDGKKVKRLHPFIEEAKLRTVLVKNLPESCTQDFIHEKFGSAGNIKRITILGHSQKASRAEGFRDKPVGISKLHAYVEYETVDAAKNAVASLNDVGDWRSGLRVELVVKQVAKNGHLKGQKGNPPENCNAKEAVDIVAPGSDVKCSDQSDETAKEEEKNDPPNKNELKTWSRHCGRAAKQFQAEGRGRASLSSSWGHKSEVPSRPIISGPKMPDGTRGFTMGRGKPIVQKDG